MDFITKIVVSSDKSQQVVLEINFSTQHVTALFKSVADNKAKDAKEDKQHD